MTYASVGAGEYVVRVRLDEGTDDPPPAFRWEELSRPEIAERLGSLLTDDVRNAPTQIETVRRLCSSISCLLDYVTTDQGVVPAPWDPRTIVRWSTDRSGHNGLVPIIWCIHYTVMLAISAMALGIPARCAVVCADNTTYGHSLAEVWLTDHRKWVAVDPTLDAMFYDGEVTLAVDDLLSLGNRLAAHASFGPGFERRSRDAKMRSWITDGYLTGRCFTHRAIWNRMDFLSHPEATAPGHGTVSFCETELVWREESREHGFQMFPYYANDAFFRAPPTYFESG
jgi:hypothetical protein